MAIDVAHVMRTYAVHGGERQLAQLFSAFAGDSTFRHTFLFVYRDDVCRRYFERIDGLALETLCPVRARSFPSMAIELAMLTVLLPVLQVSLLISLRRRSCRICVAHGVQGAMVCWLAAVMLSDVRFVYVHRGTKSRTGRLAVFRLLYWPFDVVAGVSRASTRSLQGLVDETRLTVLENGIDLEAVDGMRRQRERHSKADPLVVISVGRLMPAKGQRLLLEAFARFVQGGARAQLWLVGDGPDFVALRQLAERLGVNDDVRLLGRRSDAVELLGQADIFACASESEGLSNAVLEAMARELPSVVVDAPGVTECHEDGRTGFVVKREGSAFASKLTKLAHDRRLRARMGAHARKRVADHYSMAANRSRYEAMYRRLLGEQAGSG